MNRGRDAVDDRPASWLSIIVVMLLPAIVLASMWQVAQANTPPATTTTTVAASVPSTPSPELVTDLLSVRRYPQPLADQAARNEARSSAQLAARAISDTVGASGCLAVVDPDGLFGGGYPFQIADHRSQTSIIPASNEKLFVAAAALEVLGPDYTFTTTAVTAPNSIVDGVINGDLFLVGGGDPLLDTAAVELPRRYPAFNTTSVDALVEQLVAAGITHITGRVVGDGSRYDDEWRAPSWGSGINTLNVAPIDALVIDDGLSNASDIPPNPNQAAAVLFTSLLETAGITVAGQPQPGTAPENAEIVAAVISAPLDDVLTELLHTSDNTTAEMLVKEMAFVTTGEGRRTVGLGVVAQTLGEWGVPIGNLSLQDGSGLSSNNVTTCETLAAVFYQGPVSEQLVALLPVASRDGTLTDKLLGTPASGVMRAKTGTLTGVKALSGVALDRDGNEVVFSVVLNGPGSDEPANFEPIWAAVAELIAAYPPVVDPDLAPFEPLR